MCAEVGPIRPMHNDILRHFSRHAVGVLAGAIGWMAPGLARGATEPAELADTPSEAGESSGERHEHFHNAFVMKVAYVETRRTATAEEVEYGEAGGLDRHSALGITVERVLVAGWLHAELGTLLSSAPGGQVAFPSTALLKLPVELSEAVEAYFGGGVAVELEREKQWAPNWGVAAAAGLYLWIAPETGFNLDLEQSVLLSDEVVSERSVGGGVVTRF
jgi:hypothetical protein